MDNKTKSDFIESLLHGLRDGFETCELIMEALSYKRAIPESFWTDETKGACGILGEYRISKKEIHIIQLIRKAGIKMNGIENMKIETTRDELELVFPTPEYKVQVEEYLQEFFDNGEYEIAGDGGLDRIKDFDKWLEKVQNDLSPEMIYKDRIPSTLYLTIRKSDNKIVGNVQIRHKLNEKLLLYGGHIGDSVRPSEQRKGYATEQIRLALKKCKELGIDNVKMDCKKNNIGSAKSIQNNGGILENEVYIDNELVQRYWISLKKMADRKL